MDKKGEVVLRKKPTRRKLLAFIAQLEPCLIGMEAGASENFWAREMKKFGHDVRLISPQFVKSYAKSNKHDAADAEAICEAVSRPNRCFVPIKGIEQQDIQSLHRIRQLLIKQRSALRNQIRGLLGEYGLVVLQGIHRLRKDLPELLEDAENTLSFQPREIFHELYQQLVSLDERVRVFDQKIEQELRTNEAGQRLGQMEGIGPMIATALSATVHHKEFTDGRQVSAGLGLVPRQYSSGGQQRLLG